MCFKRWMIKWVLVARNQSQVLIGNIPNLFPHYRSTMMGHLIKSLIVVVTSRDLCETCVKIFEFDRIPDTIVVDDHGLGCRVHVHHPLLPRNPPSRARVGRDRKRLQHRRHSVGLSPSPPPSLSLSHTRGVCRGGSGRREAPLPHGEGTP